MFIQEIQESDFASLTVASLPTRPTTSTSLGGKGYTASEMKACFDALPRFIISKLNQLITELKEGMVTELIKEMDMEVPDTIYDFGMFVEDFAKGTLVDVLRLGEGGPSVGEVLPPLVEKVNAFYYMDNNYVLDAGRVSDRKEVV